MAFLKSIEGLKRMNMKKLFQFGLLALAFISFSSTTFGQKKLKEGVVKFELQLDENNSSPELAMMGSMTLDFYFTKDFQRMDMSMMAGMMRIQTFVPSENPKDGSLLMDMLGQKYQIIELEEEDLSNSNNFMNVDDLNEVEYDKDDKKEIAGYECYRAVITNKDGSTMKYYITEKINPPSGIKKGEAVALNGYPLEMEIDAGQGMVMTFSAKEVLSAVPDNAFSIPEGYQQMTMEEFEKTMGEMDMGF